jgi:hypothetical protein
MATSIAQATATTAATAESFLAAIVGGGFGMDEEAGDFGGVYFERALQGRDDGMDLGHGEVVGEGAVAVDLDAVGLIAFRGVAAGLVAAGLVVGGGSRAGDEDFMDVEDFGEGLGYAAEAEFELAVGFQGGGALDGGGFGFDMGEDGGNLGDLAAHFGFELGDESVGGAEGHGLVDFEVLFYMKTCAVRTCEMLAVG